MRPTLSEMRLRRRFQKTEGDLVTTAATRRRLLDALLAEALAPADDCELGGPE
jgi:hypothetical protein